MNVQVSSSFKKQSTKAITAIILFIIFYLFLIIVALGFTFACIAGGIKFIIAKPMIFTLLIGLGLSSLGIMVSFFN